MIKSEEAYRNTCCMCCGIPLKNGKYFEKEDGTLVRCTVDHVLLRSLNGPNTIDNLVLMCHDCNQLRGNLFAELDQFIEWYWSDEPLPKEKNFSYIRKQQRHKYTFCDNNFVKSSSKVKQNVYKEVIPVLEPTSSKSILLGTVELNGYKYNQYKHPLFGTSLVKVE
ncbi:HNH endonuclease [Cronobacter phage vB_CsaM_GAP32]|uniref:HNH endonuclease n=1 Tax=Cronobacter phage vB_CsaM_GAP32 TaxID=1141136 RepID=K4F7B7_9CAUD|nr:HNH endonuclease [Cronobacter phage vB_CsaM_GAP32]AFC21968.1 HNH endonuclease [Cronobacter phage vB_CsaM_GAP32]